MKTTNLITDSQVKKVILQLNVISLGDANGLSVDMNQPKYMPLLAQVHV